MNMLKIVQRDSGRAQSIPVLINKPDLSLKIQGQCERPSCYRSIVEKDEIVLLQTSGAPMEGSSCQ